MTVDGPAPNGDASEQDKTSSRSILIYGGFTGEVVEGDVLEMDVGEYESFTTLWSTFNCSVFPARL